MTTLMRLRRATLAADELVAALDCEDVVYPPLADELSGDYWLRQTQTNALEARAHLEDELRLLERKICHERIQQRSRKSF